MKRLLGTCLCIFFVFTINAQIIPQRIVGSDDFLLGSYGHEANVTVRDENGEIINEYTHFGIDVFRYNNNVNIGFNTCLHSIANGEVIRINEGCENTTVSSERNCPAESSGLGNYVIIKHKGIGDNGEDIYSMYLHMNGSPKVRLNQKVEKGQIIGYMGHSGYVVPLGENGTHTHFEIRKFPEPFNPAWGALQLNGHNHTSSVHEDPLNFDYPYVEINKNFDVFIEGAINPTFEVDFEIINPESPSFFQFPTGGLNSSSIINAKLIFHGTGSEKPLTVTSLVEDNGIYRVNFQTNGTILEHPLANYDLFFEIENNNHRIEAFKNKGIFRMDNEYDDVKNLECLLLREDKGDWFGDYVETVTNLGFMYDFPDNDLFKPYDLVKRKEAVRAIALAAKKADFETKDINPTVTKLIEADNYSKLSDIPFDDVSYCHTDYHYIQTLKNQEAINGIGGNSNNFEPEDTVNRAQICKILVNTFGLEMPPDAVQPPFTDVTTHDNNGNLNWYFDYIKILYNHKLSKDIGIGCDEDNPLQHLINGYFDNDGNPTGLFKPGNDISRAEFAKLLANTYEYYIQSKTSSSNKTTNTDYTTIGMNYHFTSSTYGVAPTTNLNQFEYEINDDETLILDHGINQDAYGNNYHFYWVSDGNITSEILNHRKISFNPNGVSQSTTYNVYAWVGSDNGKISEKYITITVCPSSSTDCSNPQYPNYPDIQFSQTQLTYDDVHIIGYVQDRFLSVQNNSSQAITLHADILSGAEFTINSGNGDSNLTIPAGSSEEFEVRFNPNSTGLKTGQLRIRWGNNLENSETIPLAGTGISDPPLEMDAPWNLDIEDPKEYGFIVEFSADDLAVRHTIEYADNSSFSNSYTEDFISTQSKPEWRLLPPDYGNWYIRVKSENLALSVVSPWSNTISYDWYVDSNPIVFAEDCIPADESTLAFYNSIDLHFQATGGNDPITYNIYLTNSGYPKDSPPIATGITENNYNIAQLLPNQTYHWIVEAIDADGDMDDSPTLKFYTPANTGTMTCSAQLNGGAATTNTFSADIQLTNSFPQEELAYYRLSNDGVDWDWWEQYTPYISGWNLTGYGGTASYGSKTVYIETKDLSDNICSTQASITVEEGGGVFFFCNNKTFTSLRAARNESVSSGDLYIYASPGTIDLSNEMGDDPYSFNGNDTGVALPDGTFLIGAGAEKTTLLWNGSGYSGIVLNDNTTIQGMTVEYSYSNRRTFYVGGNNVTITDCHIKGGGRSIEMDYQYGPYSNLTVQRCVINGNAKEFRVQYLTSAKIVNNIIANTGSFAIGDYTGLSSVEIRNNIFYNNNSGYSNPNGGGAIFTNNTLYGGYLTDFPNGVNGNNNVNPLFINANAENWNLSSSSPCRNTGINVGLPYYENNPDRGAYEYAATGSLSINGITGGNCQIISPNGTITSGSYPLQLNNQAIGMYEIIPISISNYYSPTPFYVYVAANGNTTTTVNYIADNDGPEQVQLRINGGRYYTTNNQVSLHIGARDEVYGIGDNSEMQFSLDGNSYSSPQAFSNKVHGFSLDDSNTPAAGIKTVWVKISDNNGNWSNPISTSIEYKPDMQFVSFPVGSTLSTDDFSQLQLGTVVYLEPGSYTLTGTIYIPSGVSIIGDQSQLIIEGGVYIGSHCHISGVHFQETSGSINFADYIGNGGTKVHVTMSNCTFDNTEEFYLSSDTLVLLNSVFKNFNSSATEYVRAGTDSKVVIENCVFDGSGVDITQIFEQKAIDFSNYDGDAPTPRVTRSIIVHFQDDQYASGGIVINNDENNPGYPIIQDNGFHDCVENVFDTKELTQSIGEFNTDPQLQADYNLNANSPVSGVIYNNPIAFNHDGTAGDLGISGGLSKNTSPSLQATVSPNEGSINQIYTFSLIAWDEETSNSQLNYGIDWNGDGILDTAPSTNGTIQHQFDSITNEIHCYVFDEHGSIARVALPFPVTSSTTAPDTPILSSPTDGTTLDMSVGNTFKWNAVTGFGNTYIIEISTDASFSNIVFTESNITDVMVDVPALVYNNEYWWRVAAVNEIGQSPWSMAWQVNNVAVCDINNINYTIDEFGTDQFIVLISFEGENTYTITDGNNTISGLQEGSQLFGPYPEGTSVTLTIMDELASNCIETIIVENVLPEPCPSPNNATINLTTATNALFTWDAVPDATFYQIWYRLKGTENWTIKGTASTQRNVGNLSPKKYYQYKIRAKCADESWSEFTEINVFYTSMCEIPTGISSIYLDNTRMRIRWDNTNEVRAKVRYSKVGSGVWLTQNSQVGQNYIYINDLTPDATYQYRVRSNCEGTDWSPYSELYQHNLSSTAAKMAKNENKPSIKIYPNPIRNILNVEFETKDEKVNINIYNYLGQIIYTKNESYPKGIQMESIDMSSFANGYYSISIQNNERTETFKFVKQ